MLPWLPVGFPMRKKWEARPTRKRLHRLILLVQLGGNREPPLSALKNLKNLRSPLTAL